MKYSFLAIAIVTLASTAYGKTLVVNNDSTNTSSPCPSAAYSTINAALAAANTGDTISVCAGTYPEAVDINKANIKLNGISSNGKLQVVLLPTAAITTTDLDPNADNANVNVILLVDSVSGVTISNITVNGSSALTAANGCSPNNAGIYFRNASGTISNSVVDYVGLNSDTSLTGCQEGIGIYVNSGNGGVSNLTVTNTSVHDYDKDGISASQAGTTLVATGNAITGAGPTTVTAQNGVEVVEGALGTVNSNVIAANDYTPSSSGATSILFYQAADNGQANNNVITESNTGIYFYLSNHGQASGNNISKMINYDGLAANASYTLFANNTITHAGIETGSPSIYLCGTHSTIQANTMNEAPIGIQDDRTTADGCSGGTLSTKTNNSYHNLGLATQNLQDTTPNVKENFASVEKTHSERRPLPAK